MIPGPGMNGRARAFALQLAACRDQLARVRLSTAQRHGPVGLAAVDLPELPDLASSGGGALDPELLRVSAVLLWARYVEESGLLRFVEALAEGILTGRVLLPITTSGARLMEYRRRRTERLTYEERRALYSRLFGGPGDVQPNVEFELQADAVARELAEIGRAPPGSGVAHHAARANAAARELGAALTARAGGMAAYAADDILRHVEEALALLHDQDLASALGGRTPWDAIRALAPQILGLPLEPRAPLGRAQAGHELLLWLAEHAAALDAGAQALRRDDAVIGAAERWLASRPAAAPSPAPPGTPGGSLSPAEEAWAQR